MDRTGDLSSATAALSFADVPPELDDAKYAPPSTSSACWRVRHHPAALCAVAVLAGMSSAFCVAGVADWAASRPSRTGNRQLMDLQEEPSLTEEDLHVEDDGAYAPERMLHSHRDHICQYDQQWVNVRWNELSAQEQVSWQLLGWYEDVWDHLWGNNETTTTMEAPSTTTLFGQITTTVTTTSNQPMTEGLLCWQEMTEDMRDGATALGYSIEHWQQCKKPGCPWPAAIPRPGSGSPCLVKMQYLEAKYNESMSWSSITQMKREKLVLLGWDPEGKSWKAGQKPITYGRPWSELTVRERDAARFLGYDPLTWETCEQAQDKPSSCVRRLIHLESKMRSWVWEDIPPGRREQLGILGWESRTWFEGELPPVMKATWIGLTSMQRTAARILGYSQDTWAGCPDAECPERFAYVKNKWATVGWMEMKLAERRAWQLLEHSESLWRGQNLPATMQKRWNELSPEQQKEANFLGHTEETWQGCNIDWSGRDANSMDNETVVDPNGAVRARMNIDRPYSEVSGNVYGKQVATMPTSFIRVFENAVARALFCGNPPLSFNPGTYIDIDGEPLCLQKTNFEKEKYRIRVLNVVEGSIMVDFFIVANATPSQVTSRLLYEQLARQVEAKSTSPLAHDKYFGRYAIRATIEEMKLNSLSFTELQRALDFESKRNYFGPERACLLHMDGKLGVTTCATSSARGQPRDIFAQDFAGPLLVLLAFFFICSA